MPTRQLLDWRGRGGLCRLQDRLGEEKAFGFIKAKSDTESPLKSIAHRPIALGDHVDSGKCIAVRSLFSV